MTFVGKKHDKPCNGYSGNLCTGMGSDDTACWGCGWDLVDHDPEIRELKERLKNEAVHPAISITPAVLVVIKREQLGASPRPYTEDDIILAFLEWQQGAGIHPISGGWESGPGFYSGVFNAADAPAIKTWFANEQETAMTTLGIARISDKSDTSPVSDGK
jgi:hypothetical protein